MQRFDGRGRMRASAARGAAAVLGLCLLCWAAPAAAADSDGFPDGREGSELGTGVDPGDPSSGSPGRLAMFQASFIMHAFGNDVTTGIQYPYNTSVFEAMPLGHDCAYGTPIPNGGVFIIDCTRKMITQGAPATGPVAGGPSRVYTGDITPLAIRLPQSAFAVTAMGRIDVYYPYLQSSTYATFVNAAGTFFAGGGPAAGFGQKTKTGMGQIAGSWIVNEGARGFGGAMGLLGKLGAKVTYAISGRPGTYQGTGSWNMVKALGRVPYATPTAWAATGRATNWLNPHRGSNTYTNNSNGSTSEVSVRGSGTPWTTGSVTLYAREGIFPTILHRAGYDTTTPSGARNLQLVTPALTHWVGSGFQTHTGHIGILTLQIAPETSRLTLLAAGLGALLALQRWSRRR